MSNSFTPKLGRICWKQGTRLDRYVNQVMRAAHAAGHVHGKTQSNFNGSRIGRGSAFGTLAGAGLYAGGNRRVIVKARITKLKRGNLGAARAHLRYTQRDGVTPEGEDGKLYGRNTDEAGGTVFLDRCEDDRHQFRLIVSPEDGAELADLKPFIRDLMTKVEVDLGTKLDWVAVDHFNTGHPHTHVVIRGKDDRGDDLIIAKDYMAHGFRTRARELLTLELGTELESDMAQKLAREVESERFTRLDRALLNHADQGFLVISAMPPTDRETHAAHMGRLRKLEDMGLVRERQTGVWQLGQDIERKLRSLGQRSDIIKTMHKVLKEAGIDRASGSYVVFDTEKPNNRIVGRLAGIGLTDEINDRHYVVVDGLDGKVHYADVGHLPPELVPDRGMIVAIENKASGEEERQRTRLRILSYMNLGRLVDAEGATWLDRELLSQRPEAQSSAGYGALVQTALGCRQQWLGSQGLGQFGSEGEFRPIPQLLNQLRARDLVSASDRLSKELNLKAWQPMEGENISGTYLRAVTLASGKFAIVQRAHEFTLVPWQSQLEQRLGKSVQGTADANGISWDLGTRQRGLGIG
jgi:type IV secretory pathway VirD2 relaxase